MGVAAMTEAQDLDALAQVVAVLERLHIPYAVGGSLASSTYGRVRFTQDADLTIDASQSKAEQFVNEIHDTFYVSREAVLQAILQRTSFNIIHFDSAFKVDLFVRKDADFDRQLLQRARRVPIPGVDGRTFSFVSPEDIILLKLRWYREGGETSDRQWDDVLGVLAVQGDALDQAYLGRWAEVLGVEDLLDKALRAMP
jgi:hypothetical protein